MRLSCFEKRTKEELVNSYCHVPSHYLSFPACQNKFKVHLAFVFSLADDKKDIKCHQIPLYWTGFWSVGDRVSTASAKCIQGNKTNSDVKSSKGQPCHHLICSCGYLDYESGHLILRAGRTLTFEAHKFLTATDNVNSGYYFHSNRDYRTRELNWKLKNKFSIYIRKNLFMQRIINT